MASAAPHIFVSQPTGEESLRAGDRYQEIHAASLAANSNKIDNGSKEMRLTTGEAAKRVSPIATII